jgi:superfamily II DNA or RNA helicase
VSVSGTITEISSELDHGHKVPIIGFSATFHRTDKRELGWSFQEVVYHLGMEEMLSKA